MRVLLASSHKYPASGLNSSGLHPREYPSGSGYHLHDLIALGLAEEGHDVFYYVEKGAETPMPNGVRQITALLPEIDICHTPIGPPAFAETILKFSAGCNKPCLLTCHMMEPHKTGAANWVFVSRSLAHAHGSNRFVLNGINPNDFVFSEAKSDYLLFMGAMNKASEKGLNLALSLSQNIGFRLVVAGTGLNYETIQDVSELCRRAGAEYLGDVRGLRKAELLAGARAVLFPSRLTEGCPLVVLEALVSGTPVISSRSGGTVEIITRETGILCDQEEDWHAAFDRLGDISPVRCREVALERYHYRRMVKDYVREYEVELERHGS
jgi:glycosyltransferase involved in cell wall biosynthesis